MGQLACLDFIKLFWAKLNRNQLKLEYRSVRKAMGIFEQVHCLYTRTPGLRHAIRYGGRLMDVAWYQDPVMPRIVYLISQLVTTLPMSKEYTSAFPHLQPQSSLCIK
jgi:hypothetical protein